MPILRFPAAYCDEDVVYYYNDDGSLTKAVIPQPDPPPQFSNDLVDALMGSKHVIAGNCATPRRAAEFTTDRMVLPLPLEVVAASMVPAIPLEFIVPLKTPEFKEFKPIKFT